VPLSRARLHDGSCHPQGRTQSGADNIDYINYKDLPLLAVTANNKRQFEIDVARRIGENGEAADATHS
jgi:hypothetical protein